MSHPETEGLKGSIIKYWNGAGLCSFDSSTSIKDPNIASCDNYVESRLLENILTQDQEKYVAGIDVGAGLGRFTVIMANHCRHVYAIEPATRLFEKLKNNCKNLMNVEVINTDLETFNIKTRYDLAIVSGILYLYPDEMVISFLKDIVNKMNKNGTLVIRDFIVNSGVRQIPSKYIDGGLCYYRDSYYWGGAAKTLGLNQINMFQCSPCYTPIYMNFLAKLHLTTLVGRQSVKDYLVKRLESKQRRRIITFCNQEIITVFMVMKKI